MGRPLPSGQPLQQLSRIPLRLLSSHSIKLTGKFSELVAPTSEQVKPTDLATCISHYQFFVKIAGAVVVSLELIVIVHIPVVPVVEDMDVAATVQPSGVVLMALIKVAPLVINPLGPVLLLTRLFT